MDKRVKLVDIANEMSFHPTEMRYFFNFQDYTVIPVMEEEVLAINDTELFEKLPEWQKPNVIVARQAISDKKNYIPLPNKYDIKEYRIMEAFSEACEDPEKKPQLQEIIKGDGVFRRFRDLVHKLDLEEEWYDFKEKQLMIIARRWCERNHIHYDD